MTQAYLNGMHSHHIHNAIHLTYTLKYTQTDIFNEIITELTKQPMLRQDIDLKLQLIVLAGGKEGSTPSDIVNQYHCQRTCHILGFRLLIGPLSTQWEEGWRGCSIGSVLFL